MSLETRKVRLGAGTASAIIALVLLPGCTSWPRVVRTPQVSGRELLGQQHPLTWIECRAPLDKPTETCTISGSGDKLLIRGTILADDEIFVRGEILLSQGRILALGCNVAEAEDPAGRTELDCPASVVSPGFINLHDHLWYDQNLPGNWGTERFEHRHEWRKGLNGHTQLLAPRAELELQVAWAELRQLITGTTSIVGSGGSRGFLRNLDSDDLQEGLGERSVISNTFPLGDQGGIMLAQGCGYPGSELPAGSDDHSGVFHVSEGIGAAAHNEFLCLNRESPGGESLLGRGSAFVHALGILAPDAMALAASGTSVIWSPRSNLSLYGNTASVTLLARLGVNIAISTDWTPSGSMHMLRELQCAASFNKTYLQGAFSARQLWFMATGAAADAVRMSHKIGRLEEGLLADLIVVKARGSADPFAAILQARNEDLQLVLRGGEPVYGDTGIVEALTKGDGGCEQLPEPVCGISKIACIQGEIGTSFGELAKANSSAYRLISCGAPDDEPSCVPARTGQYSGEITKSDRDGDGVPNKVDNCPSVFNPARPLDSGLQADWDADGIGDPCDPDPLGRSARDTAANFPLTPITP